MSSLPDLTFEKSDEGQKRVISLLQQYNSHVSGELSPAELLDIEAEKFLPASMHEVFCRISLANIHEREFQRSESKVLSAFSKFIFELKSALGQVRQEQKQNIKKSVSHHLIKDLLQGSPLEKEIKILKCQWDKIEELSVGCYADLEGLVAYKIQLLLLLRWWSFNRDQGIKTFTTLSSHN